MAAAPGLYISKANPLHFVIETGTGTIHEDEVLDGNFQAPTATTDYKCFTGCDFVQCWECGDVIKFQFVMDDSTGIVPIAVVYDQANNVIETFGSIDMNGAASFYTFLWEPDSTQCGDCYYIKLFSTVPPSAGAPNLYVNNNNGEFEALPFTFLPGGSNLCSRSNAIAMHSPTHGALVAANAIPGALDYAMAIDSTPLALVAGNTYIAKAWVYNKKTGAIGYAPAGSQVELKVNAVAGADWPDEGWTDANILYQSVYDTDSDGLDTWTEITTIFKVNADTSGNLGFQLLNGLPNAGLTFYIDDITVELMTVTLEATSNNFEVQGMNQTCGCASTLVTYGAVENEEHDQFGLHFNGATFQQPFYIRLGIEWMQFKIADSGFANESDSAGTSAMIKAFLSKIYNCRSENVPFWLIEKIQMIMKFDRVEFDGLPLICNTKDMQVEWLNFKSLCGNVQWDMVLKEYNYQNNNCGAS